MVAVCECFQLPREFGAGALGCWSLRGKIVVVDSLLENVEGFVQGAGVFS